MLRLIFPALCISLCWSACGNKSNPAGSEQTQILTGYAQGTTYMIKFRGDSVPPGDIDSIFRAIDASMSLWDPQSIICRVNRGDTSVRVDEHFRRVFEASKKLYEETSGAFDPTVLPLVNFWGFGGDKYSFPDQVSQKSIDSLKQWQGFDQVELEGDRVRMKKPGIKLDFNGIAQGYTSDVLGEYLHARGIHDFMIEVGGEILVSGNGETGDGWNIGIDEPVAPDEPRELRAILKIREALATSGSYRKFYEKDGKKYSHTIDPRTGYPVTHTLLSVSVVAPSAMLADGYATAFMVLGVQQSMQFLQEHPGLMVYMIFSDPLGNPDTWMSEGLKERMVMERNDS